MTAVEQIRAALQIANALKDAIKELGQVPAGVLYANVMGHMSLDTFETIISILVKENVVRRDASHMLTYIGPQEKEA
jgi:hypothetical protein